MVKTPEKKKELTPINKYQRQIGVALVLVLVVVGLYFYNQHQKPGNLAQNPNKNSDETKELVSKVGKLMLLPNETPTLATVSDVSQLANQSFFAHAQNGDKVLIFPNVQIAVLYRPSINKIINVGPVNLASPSPSSVNTTVTPTPTLEISPTAVPPSDTPIVTPEISQ